MVKPAIQWIPDTSMTHYGRLDIGAQFTMSVALHKQRLGASLGSTTLHPEHFHTTTLALPARAQGIHTSSMTTTIPLQALYGKHRPAQVLVAPAERVSW